MYPLMSTIIIVAQTSVDGCCYTGRLAFMILRRACMWHGEHWTCTYSSIAPTYIRTLEGRAPLIIIVNVFHKNKTRCRDGAKCLQRTHVPAWKNQLAEKLQEQGGVPFHAQQSRLTFSGIKDTLDTFPLYYGIQTASTIPT